MRSFFALVSPRVAFAIRPETPLGLRASLDDVPPASSGKTLGGAEGVWVDMCAGVASSGVFMRCVVRSSALLHPTMIASDRTATDKYLIWNVIKKRKIR